MEINYIRSSSMGQWQYCQQSYYINYVLGHQQVANKKADKGTICHAVMEWLAHMKLNYQNGNGYYHKDERFGEFICSEKEWLKPTKLTDRAVDKINYSRRDKKVFIDTKPVKYDHIRYGVSFIKECIARSYEYYSKRTSHEWVDQDFMDVSNFVWLILDYHNGEYDPRKLNILYPERQFDIEIKRDWAKLPNEEYLRIKGTIDLTTINNDVIEIIDWKHLPIETLLPTPTGWTTMGDVNIGDILFDKDGNQTNVIGKSKIKNEPCCKILFDDKTSVISSLDHIWHLSNGENKPAKELKISDKIPLTKPIQTKNIDLPIDPYVLGIWLGDGRNRRGEVCSNDEFIFNEIRRRGYKLSKNIGSHNRCESRTIYNLTKELRKLNLLQNKHIPDIYKRSSFDQRLDLVRGLMDTDGNVNTYRKQAVFTSCNKTLSNNVKELLITLGQRVNQATIKRNTNFKDNIIIYPLAFKPININPFLLPRKANLVKKEWGIGRSNIRKIVKIVKLKNFKKVQCIMVDSPSNTFLCTENMIPTHNTGRRINWATGEEKTYEKLCTDPQLMLYYYAVKHLYSEYNEIMITIFFVRNGGSFTIPFDDDALKLTEQNLRKTFEEIRDCKKPELLDWNQKDFRCRLLCDYYKNKIGNMNFCHKIANDVRVYGIDECTKRNTKEGFDIGNYAAPGE